MEELNTIEQTFNSGVLPDPVDSRDYVYERVAGAAEIDWVKGFDIRDVLGGDLRTKNQYQSSSCVGQATAQYIWVLQVLEVMKTEGLTLAELWTKNPNIIDEVSARAVYSQISLGKGVGAYIRDGALLAKNWGGVFERFVSSYKKDGTTDEDFMYDRSWENDHSIDWNKFAKFLGSKDARVLLIKTDINLFANAIKANNGVLSGVNGANGHGWLTERPTPPKLGEATWGHCLYFGAYGQDEKGKYIAFPNSWGKIVKENWVIGSKPGTGWQKIYEDYFNNDNVFNPWTLTDKTNEVPHIIE